MLLAQTKPVFYQVSPKLDGKQHLQMCMLRVFQIAVCLAASERVSQVSCVAGPGFGRLKNPANIMG